ncbi:MAG: ubiquinone biosynthesis regulatory protein kinase UbiB [Aeromonas sp.]
MTRHDLQRLHAIVRVLLAFGLDELVPARYRSLALRLARKALFWLPNHSQHLPRGQRLRLAFEQLGPIFIKFGQMLSTRRDLLPDDLAAELARLQDRVPPFCGHAAKARIEQCLGAPLATWFDDFDLTPLASASVAQVHIARLKASGQDIVIKVIRPDIAPQIATDLRLMANLARLIARWVPASVRLRPEAVVAEYRHTLLAELDLRQEGRNASELKANFADSAELYVPAIIPGFEHRDVLVMERIYGIAVSDVAALNACGTNMQLLAERGVSVFFTQVFRDNFFHADMHPGNVFVDVTDPADPRWIGIDCGIVGRLNRQDQRYLAENFLAFFNRDYRQVAELHVRAGWVPRHTDLDAFERALREVLEPIFAKPLCEISFGVVLLQLFSTARQFAMQVQPQLVLLQKTLLYVEGLGRQLYPALDLWQTAKPFLEQWLASQLSSQTLIDKLKTRAPFWAEQLPLLPDLLLDTLQHTRQQQDAISAWLAQANPRQQNGRAIYLLGMGASLLLGGVFLLAQTPSAPWGIGLTGAALLCWWLGWRQQRN